jgi:hypothetical protein
MPTGGGHRPVADDGGDFMFWAPIPGRRLDDPPEPGRPSWVPRPGVAPVDPYFA